MIRLDHVSRKWPEFAIKDISLEVREGEYLVIVGPTGAGKTLLLELLLGIHHPDSGRIFIDGNDATSLFPEKRGIGMVYQDYLLFPHLNVAHNLAFGLDYQRLSRAEASRRVEETAALLGISHLLHRFPATLSGGEKQRAAMGRALVTQPRVLLLDEPLSALDRGTARRLRGELKYLHETKKLTIIHVTHDLAEARFMGGPIALINEGELNAYGAADDLMRRPPTVFAANFFGAVNLYEARIEERPGEKRAVAGPLQATLPAGYSGNRSGNPWLMIHPDEVVLLPGSVSAGPNVLAGEVAGLTDEGNYVSVRIRVEGLREPLTVFTTRQAVRAQKIELGTAIAADVERAIHVLER
jgi:ABC-type sugar transport system ATPase subunit